MFVNITAILPTQDDTFSEPGNLQNCPWVTEEMEEIKAKEDKSIFL